jgi:hypothetical protein
MRGSFSVCHFLSDSPLGVREKTEKWRTEKCPSGRQSPFRDTPLLGFSGDPWAVARYTVRPTDQSVALILPGTRL